MSSTLQKLQAQQRTISRAIGAIMTAKQVRESKKLVGRHFKYRNCYSCPESESDYWWNYIKVVSADADGNLTAFQFWTDKYGRVEIRPTEQMSPAHVVGSYTPIVPAEFRRELRRLTTRISALATSANA